MTRISPTRSSTCSTPRGFTRRSSSFSRPIPGRCIGIACGGRSASSISTGRTTTARTSSPSPLNLTPEQLREQFIKLWNEFFKRQKSRHAAQPRTGHLEGRRASTGQADQRQGVSRQAVITGIGITSPIGHDAETVDGVAARGAARAGAPSRASTRGISAAISGARSRATT